MNQDEMPLALLKQAPGSLKALAREMTKPAKDHLVCCNPAVALCGADQRGEMFGIGAPDNKRMCSACASLSSDPHHKCCADCPGDAK